MIATLSPDNLVELPQQLVEALGRPSHFEVAIDGDRLVLTPARRVAIDDVFSHLESLNLTEGDIGEAISWARHQQSERQGRS